MCFFFKEKKRKKQARRKKEKLREKEKEKEESIVILFNLGLYELKGNTNSDLYYFPEDLFLELLLYYKNNVTSI
jgi:hypothetical protein